MFLCLSVLLALRLPRLGKRKLTLVLFVRLFDLCLFGFVGFLPIFFISDEKIRQMFVENCFKPVKTDDFDKLDTCTQSSEENVGF